MSGPTPTGNGCSLEDCYTNIFALTDICGIKWRKLCIDPVQTNIDPLEDPVLNSYTKCLQADILCVWRRVAKYTESRPADINFGKELWIFWYGDPPSVLEEILSPVLKEHEYGSWEKDSGLSYECRTLLFKALHNLIERCLFTKNFIRLGRWFVQPHDPILGPEQSTNLSFSFNFFLHGESTVCASIEVKQHPPVVFLANNHLSHSQENGTQPQVILAPYGLSGTLTGVTYRDSDHSTRKQLDEWRQFYPLKLDEAKDNDLNKLPNMVEVIVAGVRMKYPTCYVLLVDDLSHRLLGVDAGQRPGGLHNHQGGLHNQGIVPNILTAPTMPEENMHGMKIMTPPVYHQRPHEPVSELTSKTNCLFGSKLLDRVQQDSTITAGLAKRNTESMTEEAVAGTWDFGDTSGKSNCNCLRYKSKGKTASGLPGKLPDKKKGDKSLERQQSRLMRTTPFHRRSQMLEEFIQYDMDIFMPRVPANSSCMNNAGGLGGGVSSVSGSSSTQIQSVGSNQESTAVNSVNIESPSSNAPSPLEESHNGHLENVTSMDPTMPTLSPHPPLVKNGEKELASTKTATSDANLNISNNNSAAVNNHVSSDNTAYHKRYSNPALKLESATYTWNQLALENTKANNINSWLRHQQKQVDQKAFKRPCLPTNEGDQDELVTDTLYNFDSVNSWSHYPLKKMCFDKNEQLNGIQDGRLSSGMVGPSPKSLKPPTPQPPAPDPYAFSDESSSTPATISRSSMRNSRDDMFSRPSPFKEEEKQENMRNGTESFGFREERNSMDFGSITSPPTTPGTNVGGSLTREVDLIPQASDLDNLFEPDSDDDAFHQSISEPKSVEDPKCASKPPNTGPVDAIGAIAPAELARMYPTPPSLETNPALSPMTSIEPPVEGHTTLVESISVSSIKTEVMVGSLTEELTKDGMSVYKPDTRGVFPTSAKYAPVELYSSQMSPPPHVEPYKPSWQFGMPMMDKHHAVVNHYINQPSVENLPSIPSVRMPSSAIEASPAAFHQNSVGQQRTPMSYELQSPASNASSYLNKTPNSNLNHSIGTNNQIPEAHSLHVIVGLSDSILNLFKDHNFDSCNICVCNMTIKGLDLGVYIPNPTGEQEARCTCGFSAVMNKRYGHYAGLFYEDEVDITGIRDERLEARKPSLQVLDNTKVEEGGAAVAKLEDVSQGVMHLLLQQFSVPYPSCSTISLLERLLVRTSMFPGSGVNLPQMRDDNEVTYAALDMGRQAMEHCHPGKLEDNMLKNTCLHKWTYMQGPSQIPQNSLECVRLLKGLQPILQDAIQNKRVTRLWEHTYKLQGPLTWIEFHQLAGRGSDENSEPQPIPSLLCGFEKDSAHVSPYALRYWDKNMLEPYGSRRDIAYVVVTLENDFIMTRVQSFFKELSTMYEWCKLGKHMPISEKIREGILRVGKSTVQKLGNEEVDDWFRHIGDSPVAAKLRLYAQTCRHHLAPFLAQQTDIKSMFAQSSTSQRPSHHRPPDPAAASENLSNSHSEDKDGSQPDMGQRDSHDDQQDSHECPAVVIYIVNPFTYGQDWDDLNRLAMIGLQRCYLEIVPKLPEALQNNIYLQIVPLQTILDARDSLTQLQTLKNMAFSVFTSCRWNLSHTVCGRSLTGFGPAAAADILLRKGDLNEVGKQYKLYAPPFVLAPMKDKQEQLAESCSEKRENSTILMCVYCLTEDQRFLLACCTDDRGETVETCLVNIEIPNRNRRKKTSARKIGLGKLWDFIIGVISMAAKPCRLVIGRFGRIGHSELKGWAGLLSKKNIQRCNKSMRDMCSQCTFQSDGDSPFILSACLISFEQQPSFSLMPDCVNPEEKQSSNCPLQTPRDASCTHILVFPTSATATANSHAMPEVGTGGLDLGGQGLDIELDIQDFENNTDDFGSFMDVFDSMMKNSPPGSPRQDNPGSPGLLDLGKNSPNRPNGASVTDTSLLPADPQDDQPNLLQQPLAMGYYISTANTGPLPRWFWSSCPENELSPVKCFKSALHIHFSKNQDDFMHHTSNRNSHPLDSNLTCDILRFVLEKYNALSWLTFDPARNDRQSCLPLHFSVLMQMYHAINSYV